MTLSVHTFKPAVPKRYLMFIAAIVWTFAGGMLLFKGMGFLLEDKPSLWWKALIAIPLGILFYHFMFSKIFKKHSQRILAIQHDKPCVFSFFNWKSYLMMCLMIGMGVFFRKSGLVPVGTLSVMYITMSIPLLTSAVMFYIYGVKYYDLKM